MLITQIFWLVVEMTLLVAIFVGRCAAKRVARFVTVGVGFKFTVTLTASLRLFVRLFVFVRG